MIRRSGRKIWSQDTSEFMSFRDRQPVDRCQNIFNDTEPHSSWSIELELVLHKIITPQEPRLTTVPSKLRYLNSGTVRTGAISTPHAAF